MTNKVKLVLNLTAGSARGPTAYSHWVIQTRLLASAYPGERDPVAHRALIRKIVEAGVEVVVNLMEAKELQRFTPYQEIMLEYAKEANRRMEFVSFPIPDHSVNRDNHVVLDFCLRLCDRIKRGQVVLVHCWGGHGRTGTIVSIVIGILFGLNAQQAISVNRWLHDQRVCTSGIQSPQTESQCNQIRVVLDEMYHKRKMVA